MANGTEEAFNGGMNRGKAGKSSKGTFDFSTDTPAEKEARQRGWEAGRAIRESKKK